MKLSIVLPSWKDPLLIKTIDDILAHSELGDQLEVIGVLDGYWPDGWELRGDPRVRYVHLGKNRGMRDAINAGIATARGEFIARSDEHCSFGQGFDRILCDACQPNWIVTPRRFALDPTTWVVMESIPAVDYERLVVQSITSGDRRVKKWTGLPWLERAAERTDVPIDETQGMQGSFWLMPHKWWDEVVGPLDTEFYGSHYQDSHEMHFKTLQAGGKLMVVKTTWFAHKHVSFPRKHNVTHASHADYLQRAYDRWEPYYREVKRRWHEEGM